MTKEHTMTMRITRILFLCVAFAAAALPAAGKPKAQLAEAGIAREVADAGPWQPLWDGKSLAGWHEIGKGAWTIENGTIHGTHEKSVKAFGHLVTDRAFRDFAVGVRYKAVAGNSGLYFRVDQAGFSGVSGFQAEIDPHHDAGGLYETNGRAWVVKPTPEHVKTWYKPGAWNDMVVLAVGRSVTVLVNGKQSAGLVNDAGRTKGHVALQLHGGMDLDVWFQNLRIMPWTNLLPGPGMKGWKKPTGDWQMVGKAGQDPKDPKKVAVEPGAGVIFNGPKGRTRNLFTADAFGDLAAHIEFLVPKDSNSGVYFMGRYEIQVFDSFGKKGAYPGIECGGIYQRWDRSRPKGQRGFEGHSPRVNASRPPGRWQTFDVLFRAPRFDDSGKKVADARFVKVVHNGRLVHEDVELSGPTRGAAFGDEKPTGPIMLQGDHGPVAYRNIAVLPLGDEK